MALDNVKALLLQNIDLVIYGLLVVVVSLVLMSMQNKSGQALNDEVGEKATAPDEGTAKAAQARLSMLGGFDSGKGAAAAVVEEDKEDVAEKSEQSFKSLGSEQQAVLTQYTSGDGAGAAEMEKMLAKDPNNLQLLDWLAFMYYSNNETEKAIDTYSRIIKLDPSNPGQHYYLANSFYKANRIDEALHHWKKVIELKPEGKYARKATDRIKKVEAALSS